jgi:hypothetical protein
MPRSLPLLAALTACATAEGPVLSGLTDGASWEVTVAASTWPAGDVTVRLGVRTADGEPATGLDVLLITGMDGMSHAPATEWCADEGDGVYACPVQFTMPGLWHVEGTVSGGDDPEAFHLVVAVE